MIENKIDDLLFNNNNNNNDIKQIMATNANVKKSSLQLQNIINAKLFVTYKIEYF